ncbi:MAG: 4Fe-4S dicluster domain-containing protein [Anaerolineae bacterium]|nr:4Fe-4S dicluster domain-containing protein [Anaerolineae bacterium]
MTYKMLSKTDLPELIEKWEEQATVYVPLHQGDFTQFRPWDSSAEIALDGAVNTRYPPKSLLLPQSEVMFRVRERTFESTEDEVSPRVVLGVRPCDVRALQLLDTVFLTDKNEDPYWATKRSRTSIVALGCHAPCETCFCTTVGSGPFDSRGSDAVLTDLDGTYVVETRTEAGQALFASLPDASSEQIGRAQTTQAAAKNGMCAPFDPTGIKDKLYQLFDTAFWDEVQQSCLGCGICTFLCPTCYCFDIVDEAVRSERVRNWDTCMFRLYSQEASGHNPRPTNTERTRQRIMHKYAYWLENTNEIGCTGCGRCVRYCPVNLDIRRIIRSAQAREKE